MGHCGIFGYALWVTAENLVLRYGLSHLMKPYEKNLWQFLRYGP
jgi:hypothetical protein